MKILLPGYEGTKKILTANSYFINKYFPDFNVYFLNYGNFNGKLFCGQFISMDKEQVGGKESWAKYLIEVLEKLDDELIILADGDFFITQPYNKQEYNKLLEEMKTKKVGYMSCGYDNKRFARVGAYAIWNRKFLLEVLKNCNINTIWNFESRGARYINALNEKENIIAWRQVLRYDRSSALAYRRNPGVVAVGEAIEEDIDFLVSNGYLPPKEELILEHPRLNHPILKLTDINVKTIEIILRKNPNPKVLNGGVERPHAIAWGIKESVKRYNFAASCLMGCKNVVDLGCGQGFGSGLLRENGYNVMGIDKHWDIIDYAKQNYPGEYILDDIEFISHGFGEWDAVVCLETLCHLKNPMKFISNLKVKNLVVSAPVYPTSDDGYIWRRNSLSEKQFRDMFEGWQIIKEFRQDHYLTIYVKKI